MEADGEFVESGWGFGGEHGHVVGAGVRAFEEDEPTGLHSIAYPKRKHAERKKKVPGTLESSSRIARMLRGAPTFRAYQKAGI